MEAGEISPVELFMQAGPVVKLVIVSLIAASIWCWVIIFESSWSLATLKRAVKTRGERGGKTGRAILALIAAGYDEAAAFDDEDAASRRARVTGAMKRRGQEIVEEAQRGLANLAVVASVAPFVGLFGTVWGIMTSFAGIAEAKDTSLAVVAPGIAEALAATAIGLAAAIPAAFAYNRLAAAFNASSRSFGRLIEDEAGGILYAAAGHGPARRKVA